MASQLDIIQALANDISTKLDTVLEKVAAPAPTTPPTPSPADLAGDFIAKFTPLDPAAFKALYGVEFKQPLQPLPQPYVPDAVIAYARNGYNMQGEYVGGPTCKLGIDTSPEAVAIVAVSDNANNLATYYTGMGQTDQTVAAVLAKTGMIMSLALSQASLGGGSNQKPIVWKGIPWPTFVEMLAGGSPGVSR